MKKIISLAIVAVATAAITCVYESVNNIFDEPFEANVEALAQTEILVGTLCMVAPGYACSSFGEVYEEHYPA